jgi:hypothetical protein
MAHQNSICKDRIEVRTLDQLYINWSGGGPNPKYIRSKMSYISSPAGNRFSICSTPLSQKNDRPMVIIF